jgi:hypothetical protein
MNAKDFHSPQTGHEPEERFLNVELIPFQRGPGISSSRAIRGMTATTVTMSEMKGHGKRSMIGIPRRRAALPDAQKRDPNSVAARRCDPPL